MKTEFKNSGLTHILVVSGSNITFVILIITFILKYFPFHRYIKYSIILGFLGLYGSLVGWEVPVIRATIMGIISYLAIRGGIRLNSFAILLFLMACLLIYKPLSLLYDASFGLSFGATFGIIIFNTPIENFLKKYISFGWIITSISVTLSATIGSIGMLIYYFESISIFGIFANILVGGVMGILLILTTLYISISYFVNDVILYYFGYSIFLLANYVLEVASIFGKIKPLEFPEFLKIPFVVFVYFISFLYAIGKEEQKYKISIQTNHQKTK